jgi:hypothetical protein
LNVAVGYGAHGMLTGKNESVDNLFINQSRKRQFFLSLDLDLTKIQTNSHVLRTLFDILSLIKVPFSALEFTEKNGIKLHPVYF